MKKLFTIVSILVMAIACNTNQHIGASAVGLVNLEHYAAKTELDLPDEFNYMVITNQHDFDATFGIVTTDNINIRYPGFSGQTVVACIAQPTKNKLTIRFDKAEVAGKELNVYCSTTTDGEQLKNAATPVAVATVPKVLSVKKVNFFTNGTKVMSKAADLKTQQINAVKEDDTQEAKPVVLKRMMRRPAVI